MIAKFGDINGPFKSLFVQVFYISHCYIEHKVLCVNFPMDHCVKYKAIVRTG